MYQKIFNNIVIIILIVFILNYFSPNKESTMYILRRYFLYIIHRIKLILSKMGLINYVEKFTVDNYSKIFIKSFQKMNPTLTVDEIKTMYNFINSLTSDDIDNYFLTPSSKKSEQFSDLEIEKIKTILLTLLNRGDYVFTNIEIIKNPKYYKNFSGKDIEPFVFTVECDKNIGKLTIYIETAIRKDVVKNTEVLAINKIKLLINNKQDIKNMYNLETEFEDKNLMDPINYNYDEKMFQKTNYVDDYLINNDNYNQSIMFDYDKNMINYEVTEYESNNAVSSYSDF